ncbi:VUT family protein [Deltaproteobacteria bacterium IMCC39524]|nr:VUT family protein [Deltaproteobacteria bacterium IMCC39524]
MFEVLFYLGSIVVANLLVMNFGIIQVAGLSFPAGAVAVGFTFTARDLVQRRFGKWGCWIWMFVASWISAVFSPTLALASLGAFVVAEGLDWAVFTASPLSFRGRAIVSNIVGTPLDSVVFVYLAFGPIWDAMWGQTIIKLASSLLIVFMIRNVQETGLKSTGLKGGVA